MICICIKVLSLDAPSVLKTFMEVNSGKKFFAIHDIFLALYFSCPRFMWKDYTQHLIRICTLIIHTDKNITMYSFYRGRALASQSKLHHGTKQFLSKSWIDITNLQHFLCAFQIHVTRRPDAQLKSLLTLPLSLAFTSFTVFLVT